MSKPKQFHLPASGVVFLLAITGLLVAASAQASLISRLDGQAVYDTDLNVTWLSNANLTSTNSFGIPAVISSSGALTWTAAKDWVAAMNTANYLGYNDWRLPTSLRSDPTCGAVFGTQAFGYGCTGSEMGHLFYTELGGVAGQSITTTHNANYALFTNIGAYPNYWSGTADVSVTEAGYLYSPYNFSFGTGYQYSGVSSTTSAMLAWAVRTGDVAAVPIPAMTIPFMLSLAGLAGVSSRNRG